MFDKYTKLMLTIIAVGIIGINIHIFKGSVIEDAYAVDSHTHYAYEIYGIEDHSHYDAHDEDHTHHAYEIYGIEDHSH